MENFKADPIEIADNELVLSEYRELRQYLLKRLARVRNDTTERRMIEKNYLKNLLTILDVSAVIATDNDDDVKARNALYFHLS
jgi:hypothetical protein